MLRLRRGDTNQVGIVVRRPMLDPSTGEQVVDAGGRLQWQPVNLAGALLKFTARDRKGIAQIEADSDPLSGKGGITFVEPFSQGRATIVVPPEATVNTDPPVWCRFDVQLVEADETVTTVAEGNLVVVADETYA